MKNIKVLTTEENLSLNLSALYDGTGYGRYRMSKFEEYSLYLENKSFLPGENVITFNDMDGKLLALKPDVTLSIVKNVADTDGVKKVYYNENVYRLDKNSGKYREIGQIGLEAIGRLDGYTMFEVISLALKSLAEIDVDYVLDVSNLTYVTAFLDTLKIADKEEKNKLAQLIGTKNLDELMQKSDLLGFDAETKNVLKKLITANGNFSDNLAVAETLAKNAEMSTAVLELRALYDALKEAGLEKQVRLDFSIICDTNYYNDIVFRGYVKNAPRAVLSGGRYDKLAEKFSKGAQAVGFAIYLNEVSAYYGKTNEYDVDVVILYDKTANTAELAKTATDLRAKGLCVSVLSERPNKLKYESLMRFDNGALTEVENA